MKLTIDVSPCPKPRMTRSDKWKTRPAVMRYRKFCDDLRLEIKGEPEPAFKIRFNVPMPKSWSNKKKREMDDTPHQQKPDIDNYLKAFMDALCKDDSFVYDVHATKYWSTVGGIEYEE